jgi:hypothetical protein
MTLAYDERASRWIAFAKVNGIPMLAYAGTMKDAMTWLYELIEGEKNAQH